MKKLKAIFSVLMAAAMSVTLFSFVGCGSSSDDKDPDNPNPSTPHEHTYETGWSSDESGHWHATTCGHDVKNVSAHRLNANYVCTTCGYQHEHTYEETWTFDGDKHWHEASCGHTDFISDEGEHDLDETKTCKVCDYEMPNAGISISKTVTEYTLSKSKPTVTIPTNDISVKLARVDESLVKDITDYTLEYYKGGEKLDNLENLGGGAYNIWAKATVDIGGEQVECESFVIVYVIDDLDTLKWNKTAEGTVSTQGKSVIDRMSDTWSFTATYKSGKTETVRLGENCFLTGLDTNKETAGSVATATYTVYNSKGVSISKTASVFYTVTAAQNNVVTSVYDFNGLKASLTAEQQALGTYVLPVGPLGGNEFMTVLGENVAWYRGGNNNLLEMQNDAFKVSITGVGTITIGVDSTNSTNISSIALKDSQGNLIEGTPGADCVEKDDDDNAYSVRGKGGLISFIILTPGEYTICSVEAVTVAGEIRDTNRHTRITSLIVVDEKVVTE